MPLSIDSSAHAALMQSVSDESFRIHFAYQTAIAKQFEQRRDAGIPNCAPIVPPERASAIDCATCGQPMVNLALHVAFNSRCRQRRGTAMRTAEVVARMPIRLPEQRDPERVMR